MLPPTCQLRFRGLMEPGVRDMLSVANWGGNASFLPDPKAPLEKMVAEWTQARFGLLETGFG